MPEDKTNGPAGERTTASTRPETGLQAECEQLREQLRRLTAERDSLRKLVTLLESKDEEDFYAVVRLVRDEIQHGQSWNPGDEKDWTDARQMLKELEQEFGIEACQNSQSDTGSTHPH
jgi:hypothetical protein